MNTQDERGSVLMLVVIFSLIMCLLGFAVMYMNGNEYLAARRDLLDARAAYLADAGLAMGVGFLYYCDARLEDEDDMQIAESGAVAGNPGELNNFLTKTTRGAVVLAMRPNPVHGNRYGRKIGDGTYYLWQDKKIDNAFPPAWCDVWISSAANNLASAGGPYYYRISSRGMATYGYSGVVDSVKDEELFMQMKPPPGGGLNNRGGRYYYNYWVVSGKRFSEKTIQRIIHY